MGGTYFVSRTDLFVVFPRGGVFFFTDLGEGLCFYGILGVGTCSDSKE